MLVSDVTAIRDSHRTAAEDDQQQVNYPGLWEELWTQLDSGVAMSEETRSAHSSVLNGKAI